MSGLISSLVSVASIFLTTFSGRAEDVLEIARAIPEGGGYEWKGTGVPVEIRFNRQRILAKGQSTYCSGFTFAVVMEAASKRGLLRDKSVDDIKAFQKHWYGATDQSGETQCAFAVLQLGIGQPIPFAAAAPGDFLQLWRTNKSGHSVVFFGWVKEGARPIGVRYRSSQRLTKGVGDRVEYFAGVPGKKGAVDANRMYFCRLDEAR